MKKLRIVYTYKLPLWVALEKAFGEFLTINYMEYRGIKYNHSAMVAEK